MLKRAYMVNIKNLVSASLLATTFALAAPAAYAANFSYTGTFSGDDDVLSFDFVALGASNVTLRTWSYAGGTNAAGQTIARGGFDPILSLYDLSSGVRIGQNDDGGLGLVAPDAVTGAYYDTFFTSLLSAGNYRVIVTQFANFAPDTLGGIFPGSGTTNFVDFADDTRDSHWAFDILNVD